MRLTLRTLLAYLDNTLDPQDAEKLREKLGESGFATQLVQRIRNMLANGSIPAPSPEAVGPVEEANVISEYLDSTLSPEQIAEIERACLESDPHLAEAAACHQILTMVLGKPAEVSSELRERIYELPEREIEKIAVAGSFSSVNIPSEQPQLKPLVDSLPTADVIPTGRGEPVAPVGIADSGVSDAPTRIREAGGNHGSTSASVSGSKGRSVDKDSKIYSGSIRPSRITPWLVSLALAGVLLFALTRIFQPLLQSASVNKTVAYSELDDPIEEIEVASDEAPIMVDVNAPGGDVTPAESIDDGNTLPTPEKLPGPNAPPADADLVDRETKATEAETVSTETVSTDTVTPPPNVDPADADMPAPADVAANDTPPVISPLPPPPRAVAEGAVQPVPPPASDVVEPAKNEPAKNEVAKNEVAKITSQQTLLLGLVGDQWVRLKNGTMVGAGQKIVCAPTFRGQMEISNAVVTLVGPAQVEWLIGDEDDVTLHVEFGKILVSATKADASLNVRLSDETIQLSFAELDSVASASVKYFRAPGFDPLKPEHRVPLVTVLSVQGTLQIMADGQSETLQTGQQWIKRGPAAAKVSPVESVPNWIDPPDPAQLTLELSARNGLLELLKGDQALEIALREATLFRRTEVGALAAQTLLSLGRSDTYFGGDGILSQPKQRTYWPDHYIMLLATVDRSAESAEQLNSSIASMNSANAKPLFQLLTGYSQNQLAEGGDEELVQLLDSSSMAVRVLALEDLRKITGTTLNFRAEQENAVRRAPGIKKWLVRLRKGDIRWQQ